MVVDKSILGMFVLMMNPEVILDSPPYLHNVINNRFMSLSITSHFRFPSLVTYLFLYSNVDKFTQLGLNIVDVNKNKKSVVFSTDPMRKEVGNEGLFEFTSSFLPIVHAILNGRDIARLLPESQSIFKLRKDVRYGD